jgi:phosphoserine/homoserine phosphotransferase
MYITCLDLEGVLVPEIWIEFAEAAGIPELKKTTRDEPDYDKLMKYRIDILNEHGLGLKEIQNTIEKIDPLPGAKDFLDKLRAYSLKYHFEFKDIIKLAKEKIDEQK